VITATMSLRRLLVHHCLRHDLNPGRVPPFILAKAKSAVSYLDARLIHRELSSRLFSRHMGRCHLSKLLLHPLKNKART
jgi:hypothetical protein